MMLGMDTREQLLKDIWAFLEKTGMSPTGLGKEALNDGGFMHRLQNGTDIRLGTVDRVRKFMADWKPPARPKRRQHTEAAA